MVDAGLVLDRGLTVLLETVMLICCPLMSTPVSSRICWHLERRGSRRVRFTRLIPELKVEEELSGES